MTRAVVLLSGGLDSVTALAMASAGKREVLALGFVYGQRHVAELDCARIQAQRFGARQHEIVDLSHMGRLVAAATSLVAGGPHAVPKDRAQDVAVIPSTYVPARNTIFLAYALAWAEAADADEMWIGVNALDYSGYPDCRPDFMTAFAELVRLGTRRGVEGRPIAVVAPLQHLRKHEIIVRGLELGVDYADTLSCYDPIGSERALACGHCDSCQLRREGFALAGVADPTRYG